MKLSDALSERMVFGIMIVGGYLGVLFMVAQGHVDSTAQNFVSTSMGVLGTALGAIVGAIWKSDRADKDNAQAMASLASTVAAQSPQPIPQPQSEPQK